MCVYKQLSPRVTKAKYSEHKHEYYSARAMRDGGVIGPVAQPVTMVTMVTVSIDNTINKSLTVATI